MSLGGIAPLLATGLFVLSAFFDAAAVAAPAGINITTSLIVLLLVALVATGCTIILRITSRRVLT